jgi:predicted double-glycine peptidase
MPAVHVHSALEPFLKKKSGLPQSIIVITAAASAVCSLKCELKPIETGLSRNVVSGSCDESCGS